MLTCATICGCTSIFCCMASNPLRGRHYDALYSATRRSGHPHLCFTLHLHMTPAVVSSSPGVLEAAPVPSNHHVLQASFTRMMGRACTCEAGAIFLCTSGLTMHAQPHCALSKRAHEQAAASRCTSRIQCWAIAGCQAAQGVLAIGRPAHSQGPAAGSAGEASLLTQPCCALHAARCRASGGLALAHSDVERGVHVHAVHVALVRALQAAHLHTTHLPRSALLFHYDAEPPHTVSAASS